MRHYIWKIKNLILSILGRKTIGVRGIVIHDSKVLLVKHSYMPQWYHAGGGVEPGETPIKAMQRELMEEVGIKCLKSPKLFNVYHSGLENRDDYIVFYIIEHIEQVYQKCSEISASQWFSFSNLPPDISPATKRRIDEYLAMRDKSDVEVSDEKW